MKKVLVASIIGLLVMSGVYMAIGLIDQTVQASVTVPASKSIAVSPGSIDLGSHGVGGPYTPETGYDPITITVDSNTVWTVKGSAPTSFTAAGSGSLASSYLKWDTSAVGTFANTYAVAPGTTVASGSASGGNQDLYHQLTIPAGTLADSYTLDITYSVS